jgi:hypothetical protein
MTIMTIDNGDNAFQNTVDNVTLCRNAALG